MGEYEGIRERLREQIDARKEHLADGSCENMADYHKIVGQIEAFRYCVELLGVEQSRQSEMDF